MHSGTQCIHQHNAIKTLDCPYTSCPIHCEGAWSSYGKCSNQCGESQEVIRTYSVNTEPIHGGEHCRDSENRILRDGMVESSNCPFVQCTIDCQGTWGGFATEMCPTQCIQTSNTIPKMYKYYDIIREAQNDGEQCPHKKGDFEVADCPFNYCPIDCVGYWTNWAKCENVACGDSNHIVSRTYVVTTSN